MRHKASSLGVATAVVVAAAAAAVVVATVGTAPPAPTTSPGRPSTSTLSPEGVPGTAGPAVRRSPPLPGALDWEVGWNRMAFIQDSLWTDGDRQYAVWVDPGGRPSVGVRVRDRDWDSRHLSGLEGDPFDLPVEVDSHNVFAVATDALGYVHVSGNMHGDRLRYARTRRPHDLTSWVKGDMVGRDESSVTYPAFVRRRDGGLLFFYRDGSAGEGRLVVNVLAPGEREWRRLAVVLDGRPTGESPYPQHVAVDPRSGRIGLMYVWRKDRRPASNADIGYLESRDGGRTWTALGGEPLPRPVTHGDARPVHQVAPGSVIVNSGGFAFDGAGRPHGAFLVRAASPADHAREVHHVWHDGRRWHVEVLDDLVSVAGRPSVVAVPGSDPVLLWTRRREGGTDLVVQALSEGADPAVIATAPVEQWEPTYDTSAASDHGVLHMLTPLSAERGGVVAVVTTVDLRTLHPRG